ncbi:hypothetical protein HYALB_00012146 [Hymenoscyphus albidus]|uniref:Cytochrome P450 n=1 Tax=Hymenoscyphus albidus TaxID=595503 RepID=A0A9N9PU00_9HELO|nr:hypothetical protein HYALB_00012146 [Hymenoscyphus albidus]
MPNISAELVNKSILLVNKNNSGYIGTYIVTMRGPVWKKWRNIFNPGFSAGNLTNLVPSVVKKTGIFISILEKHSEKQDIIKMKNLLDNLTMDIIGQVVMLGERFRFSASIQSNSQRYKKASSLAIFRGRAKSFHQISPTSTIYTLVLWPKVDKHISGELQKHIEAHNQSDSPTNKSVVGLALKAYESESSQVSQTKSPERKTDMDPFFKKICIAQIKLFLFSGHDTTSSSICYTLYLLSKHPNLLRRVQEELDQVFSADRRQISERITQKPALLKEIPYTTAVIRESLRLFPTVSSTCDGERDFFVTDSHGRRFPTENFLVWVNPHAVHHTPELWENPDEFQPERWSEDKRKQIPKGAWRAFEHGARNYIGQVLAMLESKILVCMVARDFVVRDVYEELEQPGSVKRVVGERAYQVQLSQPAGDLPCRIERI